MLTLVLLLLPLSRTSAECRMAFNPSTAVDKRVSHRMEIRRMEALSSLELVSARASGTTLAIVLQTLLMDCALATLAS